MAYRRVVSIPEHIDRIVFGIFSFQSQDQDASKLKDVAASFETLLASTDAITRPILIEYAQADTTLEPVYLVYWSTTASYTAWTLLAAVLDFWNGISSYRWGPGIGAGREIAGVDRSKFDYCGRTDYLSLGKEFGETPTDVAGWGSFRKRLVASGSGDVTSPVAKPEEPLFFQHVIRETLGRTLKVTLPYNVCLLRETQVLDLCPPAHIERWDKAIVPALKGWLDSIDDDPSGSTGCVGLHRIREVPPPTSPSPSSTTSSPSSSPSPASAAVPTINRTTQIAYWLSLGHAERTASRSQPHKVLRHAYAAQSPPNESEPLASQLWSGVHILDEGFEATYVNCRAATGLLKWFEGVEVKEP